MSNIKKLVISAIMLALCLLLPFLTGQIKEIGSMLCPMHFPVLLCGILCGWKYGALVGGVAPVLRLMLFGMPPMPVICPAMTFELLAYGALAGILFAILPKTIPSIYASLIGAMVGGRIVWGVAMFVILPLATGASFTWQAYLAGAVLGAIPGIIAQIIIIPVLVIALQRAKVLRLA